MTLEVVLSISTIMPGYEPEIRLYMNHGGGAKRFSLRIYFGLRCQSPTTLAIEPTRGSRLISPCHVTNVAKVVTAAKEYSIHRLCFVGFVRKYTKQRDTLIKFIAQPVIAPRSRK